MLAGIGKTVEVFSLILARPPPAGILGKRAAAADADAGAADGAHDATRRSDYVSSDDDEDDCAFCPMFRRAADKSVRASAEQPAAAAREGGSAPAAAAAREPLDSSKSRAANGAGSWPAPGKWAGATLVVTPPAILQQWVAEAQKRTAGLRYVAYCMFWGPFFVPVQVC